MSDSETPQTRVHVNNGVVSVTMGEASATVPVDQLPAFIRILEGARLIAGTAPNAAVTLAEAGEEGAAAKTTPKKKRRSRKRVGDALVQWMRANPGWHSEEELLRVVVENKMSDASPKRALKIALGKQRGQVFEGDDNGHWKLVEDADAGPPPQPEPRTRRSSRASGRTPARRVVPTPVSSPGRRRTRLRAKKRTTRPPTKEEGSPAEEPEKESRTVLVKKGQERKKSAPTEPEEESGRGKRWQRVSSAELERARRNLLGLGSATDGD